MKLLDLAGELVVRFDRGTIRPMTLEVGRLPVIEAGLSQWSTALEFYNSKGRSPSNFVYNTFDIFSSGETIL
jgi:hypothetical protein